MGLKFKCDSCDWIGDEQEADLDLDSGDYICPICSDRLTEQVKDNQ